MDRRTYVATVGVALGAGLAGCLGDGDRTSDDGGDGDDGDDDDVSDDGSDGSSNEASAGTGVLSTAVSDDPADIDDFEKLVVTIDEVWVHPAGSDDEGDGDDGEDASDGSDGEGDDQAADDTVDEESEDGADEGENEVDEGEDEDDDSEEEDGDDGKTHDESDEPIRIDVDGAEADLVQLQGDAQKVIDSTEIEVGTYGQVKLWVDDEVDAVLADGSEPAEVVTPGNAPLKFNKEFEVRAGFETTFTADFAPHARGRNGYILRPVAEEVRVEYNEIEDSDEETEDGDGAEEDPSDDDEQDGGEDADDGEGTDDGKDADDGTDGENGDE